jgi:hypothetical protein
MLTARKRFRSPKSDAIEKNENIFDRRSTVPLGSTIDRHVSTQTPQRGNEVNAGWRRKFHPACALLLPINADATNDPTARSCGRATIGTSAGRSWSMTAVNRVLGPRGLYQHRP